MPPESEGMKKLVDFKEKLEKKIESLKSELEEQQSILELVNSILLERGFKRAEITKEPKEAEASQREEERKPVPPMMPLESEEPTQLTTGSGELLAYLHMNQDSLRIVPAEDKTFNVNTPPFKQFLVERVLEKMEEKDNELVKAGDLTHENIFSFHIVQEDDILQELVIKNFDEKRLRELKSSARWTLEKMCEKTE